MNQTSSRLYLFVQFLRSTIILLSVLIIVGQVTVLCLFIGISLDCKDDLSTWYNFLHSETHLIGDAEVDDFIEFRTTPFADGSYDVYYVGTIYPDVRDRLIGLCQQSSLNKVVIQRITLPNGIRKWLTISLDTLRSSCNFSQDYDLPVLITETVHIQVNPTIWFRAQCIRPCQDWMARTGCTPFVSCLLCVASIIVIGALAIFFLSLLDRPFTSYTRRVLAAQRGSKPTMIIDVRGATFTLVEPSPKLTTEPPSE